jgi:hypothetical protein
MFVLNILSSPETIRKIEEEMEHQKQGGNPRPIIINDKNLQPDTSSDASSKSESLSSEAKQ